MSVYRVTYYTQDLRIDMRSWHPNPEEAEKHANHYRETTSGSAEVEDFEAPTTLPALVAFLNDWCGAVLE